MSKTNFLTILTITVFFTILVSPAIAADKILYVDADAVGANNGSDWENAYLCLRDALEDAFEDAFRDAIEDNFEGDIIEAQVDYEIRVANGIYKPDCRTSEGPDGTLSITASGDWTDTFLIQDMTVKGGYAGFGEPDPNVRDINRYETILSGDLYGNDIDISNPGDLREEPSRAENSYHVVICQGNSVIDGFTITGGNANDPSQSRYSNNSGGGLYVNGWPDTLQITNCTFTRNSALSSGGGIYTLYANINLTNCTFTENQAGSDGGGGIYAQYGDLNLTNCSFIGNQAGSSGGGGIKGYNCALNLTDCEFIENSTRYGEGGGVATEKNFPYLTNCTFIENSARAGGGLYNETSNPTLANCVFRGNSVSEQGGGMCSVNKSLSGDSPILKNCLFTGNHSGFRGGAIYILSCEPVLANCTFAENWAGEGNAIYCKSEDERNIITLTNCILWDYGTEIETWDNNLSIINVSYSNIRGGWFGEGNIDVDPLFVDQLGPDHRSRTEDDNLRLAPVSPCIDTGDPYYDAEPNETDLDGNPRIVTSRVDMGAYEFQGLVYVDDDAPYEQWTGEPEIDHLEEDGSEIRPFDTIQEAIDMAKDGYTVLVRPGIYYKIDFMGKAITVAGIDGAPIIDTSYNSSPLHGRSGEALVEDAVTFHTGEGRNSMLKNFIITNSSTAISLNFSGPKIYNVTIVGNNFGIAAYENSNPDIRNCILWDNTDGDLFQCEAKYSCIETGTTGEGSININPLFVDAANGDYHLKSEGWRWNTIGQSWTWDDVTSRCIDAGDPCMPLGDEPLSVPRDPNNLYGENRYINMGAFGGTCQASMPPLNWPPAGEDRTPPIPNPAQWAPNGAPREINIGGSEFDFWVQMTAMEATDASGLVEYFFQCTTEFGFSSGWQSSNEYSVQIGRGEQNLRFRVKARDLYGNETAWSDERTAH